MNEKILIVEDERVVAKDIERTLQKLGYFILGSVASGEEAIQVVTETQPDLILMDIQLRGEIDGIETVERIHADWSIPVIYLTAYADENTLQRAKITEPFAYIIKPFDERDLRVTIEIALRRRLAEAAVRAALAKEQELSELKSRFWSMLTHEFRNPLTTILSAAQLIEQQGHSLPEGRKRDYLYLIQRSVRSLDQLLNDVLAVNKAEAGKLEYNPIPIDLFLFCQSLVEEAQFNAGPNHQIIFVSHSSCSDACIDPKLLRHILSNLLSNAVKYSPQGGEVDLEMSCPNGSVVFEVKDTGIGIPAADQRRLFEAFHRAENVGNIPGTGLGMTMVKKCLDLQGGKINVNSRLGVGTTVTVTIPFKNLVEQNKSEAGS